MTQEEKLLLLKDLCARLPYRVIGLYTWKCKRFYNKELTGNLYDELKSSWNSTEDSQFLPYLRPMSSITEEEYEELWRICDFRVFSDDYDVFYRYGIQIIQEINNNKGNHQNREVDFSDYEDLIDWLNEHHFDYRGLIEKGLALEAPEGMYKTE